MVCSIWFVVFKLKAKIQDLEKFSVFVSSS